MKTLRMGIVGLGQGAAGIMPTMDETRVVCFE
jgi:hypothetical protein